MSNEILNKLTDTEIDLLLALGENLKINKGIENNKIAYFFKIHKKEKEDFEYLLKRLESEFKLVCTEGNIYHYSVYTTAKKYYLIGYGQALIEERNNKKEDQSVRFPLIIFDEDKEFIFKIFSKYSIKKVEMRKHFNSQNPHGFYDIEIENPLDLFDFGIDYGKYLKEKEISESKKS